MSITVVIEVAVTADTSPTARGNILESFAGKFLGTQNYSSVEQVRLTGMEVDLLATEITTGERVLVECKAYRTNIASEVISKLLGNVVLGGYASGWLISTAALSKDARGVVDTLQQRSSYDRRRLQIYEPVALVDRLVRAGIVVAPQILPRDAERRYADEAYLLLTNRGTFWAQALLDAESGVRSDVVVYQADNGSLVNSFEILNFLASTDSTLAGLNWIRVQGKSQPARSEIAESLENIVRVPVAEHWADYRPARPVDFVGREPLQKGILDFLDRVRRHETRTRLFAIKGPSGWGKSSSVLKIAEVAGRLRGRRQTYVFPVDSRAATSKRFGELALHKAVHEAMDSGFIAKVDDFSLGGVGRPFATEAMRSVLNELNLQNKVICIIFDQFEELLYKEDLSSVFDQIRILCNAIDEAQENIVIGFAWKTDGTVPSEHPAYFLWHDLAERRLEFEVRQFNPNEVTRALNRFAAELGQPLSPQLRRLLQDHCQGFPWLIKKLCIHVLERVSSGVDQNELLLRSLRIEELFLQDFQGLDAEEHACIKNISAEAPADFFKIVDHYGDAVVNRLLNKRLIIRSGPRLNVYWDIFRDYVLTGRVPYIPVTYVPQSDVSTYVRAVEFLLQRDDANYDELAGHLGIAKTTADNIVRDLVMLGNAEANRRKFTVRSLFDEAEDADDVIRSFWTSHVVYRALLKDLTGEIFTYEQVSALVPKAFFGVEISDAVAVQYAKKIIRWWIALGFAEKFGGHYTIQRRSTAETLVGDAKFNVSRRGRFFFLGESPPSNVLMGVGLLLSGFSRAEVDLKCGRNAWAALQNLGLIDPDGQFLRSSETDPTVVLEEAARRSPAVIFVRDLLANEGNLKGRLVGEALSDNFGLIWSPASQKRYGPSVKQWAIWAFGSDSKQENMFDNSQYLQSKH